MKVLLLGATGAMGHRTAAELVRHGGLEQLTLSGRDPDALERLSGLLKGSIDIRTDAFDLTADDLASHLEGYDVAVSCAGPGYRLEERCVEGAIQASVSYVSLNDDEAPARAVVARHDEAAAVGVTLLSGCGMAPGISNLLVALAVDQLDEVDEVEIAVGASSADAAGPATDLHFVSMFQRSRAEGDDDARSPHPVYLPEPVGWIETFTCGHPEEIALRSLYPSLDTIRFRVGLAEKAVMDTVRAGAAIGLGATERRRRYWLKASSPLRPLLQALSPGTAPWTAVRVDVHGRKKGRTAAISYGVVDRLVNLASIPLVLGALSLGDAPRGVISIERLGKPADMLKRIAARGVRFGELEPHSL